MSTKGLKYPIYAVYESNAYTGGAVLGKALTASASYEFSDGKLYADDALQVTDKEFISGTLSVGVYGMSIANRAILLGHTQAVAPEVGFVGKVEDVPPYVGFGFYGKKIESKWIAFWYPKVQFAEPSDELATKGESVEYKTPTLEGTLMKDDGDKWIEIQEFTSEADAIAYLNAKAGLPVSESLGLSALLLTGTGGTLSPAFGAAVRYYTFGGVTGADVKVKATAASHTIKLYVDGTFNQNLTSGSDSAAIALDIGAKKLTIVAQEAGKSSQTTEVIVVKTA